MNEDNSNVKKDIDKTLVEFYLEGIDGSMSFGLEYSHIMLYNLNVSSVYISHCHAASDDILYNILLSFLVHDHLSATKNHATQCGKGLMAFLMGGH